MRPRVLLLLAALSLSLLASSFLAVRWQQAETRARKTERWTRFVLDSLGSSVTFPRPPEGLGVRDSIYWQWVATTAQLQSRRWQQVARFWVERRATLLEPYEVEEIRRKGLGDPARQLRDSLTAHPELIPYKGVLGGQMGFYSTDHIVILSSSHVFAPFDDGHIGGSMLLEYEVLPGPRIVWKRLWAKLE